MDQYIGKRLGDRYEITELIGVGGMANVYKAIDHNDNDKIVAVKILREEFLENEEFVRRFKNESKAIAVLSHPNIVKVYDVSFTDRSQYIVMEYVDGVTLKEYIEMQGQVNWKEVIHFTTSILQALDHAHSKGIVHRDIKPQNIMLLSNGEIKVMDFGIARFARSETGVPTNKAMGSVHYISPEQAKGEKTDVTTDIYSVGVMMYEMLTGVLPFDGDTPISVAIKQISDNPKRPREINPDIPVGLEEIVIRAMQKEPEKRYQSAIEMLTDVEEIKHDPNKTFGYRYLSNEETGAYFQALNQKTDMIESSQDSVKGSGKRDTYNDFDDNYSSIKTPDPSIYDQEDIEDEEEVKKKSTLVPILIGVGIAFALCAVAAVIFVIFVSKPFSKTKEIDVPDVLGYTIEELQEKKEFKDFEFKMNGWIDDDKYEKDKVCKQTPEPGAKLKKGGVIKVKISNGGGDKKEDAPDKVPSLSGLTKEAAMRRLEKMGVKYKIEEIDSSMAKGEVVRTKPAAGERITENDEVIIYISKNNKEGEDGQDKDMKTVPDILGFEVNKAKQIIGEAGLRTGTIKRVDSDKPEGTVLTQDPAPGTQMKENSNVSLEISSGRGKTYQYKMEFNLPQSIDNSVIVEIVVANKSIFKKAITPAATPSITETFSVVEGDVIDITLDGETLRSYQIVSDGEGSVTHSLIYDNSSMYSE